MISTVPSSQGSLSLWNLLYSRHDLCAGTKVVRPPWSVRPRLSERRQSKMERLEKEGPGKKESQRDTGGHVDTGGFKSILTGFPNRLDFS